MAEIVHGAPQLHRCYEELHSFHRKQYGYLQYGYLEYGTIVECSCGRRFRLERGNIILCMWDSLSGRDHLAGGRSVFDRWVLVYNL